MFNVFAMFKIILAQNCQAFDNLNFDFLMSRHNAHCQSYKNAPVAPPVHYSDGAADGAADGSADGSADEASDGSADEASDGSADEAADGSVVAAPVVVVVVVVVDSQALVTEEQV